MTFEVSISGVLCFAPKVVNAVDYSQAGVDIRSADIVTLDA